jgi:hypothetical protein
MKVNFLTFIGLNIVLCCVLLTDAFVLPTNNKTVTLSDFSSKLTRAKRVSYYNYFIYTSDDCKYEVSETVFENLRVKDSVKIFSSLIFKMPIEIHYWRDDLQYASKIGQLNSKKAEEVGLIVSLLISAIVFIIQVVRPIKKTNLLFLLQIIAFGTSFTIFLFVVIEIFSI